MGRNYKKIVELAIVPCIFLFLCNNAYSQIDREFWFAVPKETVASGNITQQNNVSFKITAYSETAHVLVEMPGNPAFSKKRVTILPYTTQIVRLAVSNDEFAAVYANTAGKNAVPVTCITNRGIHISSDFDISVYYDYDMMDNRDLFALKGRNGYDTEFFTPFQNIARNSNAAPKYTGGNMPFSSIIIIATDTTGPTVVTITPPVIAGAVSPIFQGRPNNLPFTVTLNKGETYCLVSRGQLGIDHPVGTKITSDKKVTVVTNDDTVIDGTCEDIMGDQIVGTSIIGAQYVVMTGGNSAEHIYVVATQPATTVSFYNKNGVQIGAPVTLNTSQSYHLQVSGNDPQTSIYINASSNIYVWHTTSLDCQFAAAILPPITNCTGSREVSFYRANTINSLTVNLMVPRNSDLTMPPDAADQAINFFSLKGDDGTNIPIQGSWFELNTASNWFVLKAANRNFTGITKNGVTYTITNTRDFFHCGFTNGHDQKANKYGYFSSFNVMNATAYENSTETANKVACFGDTIVVRANGGMEYNWHYAGDNEPPTYISKPTSAITRVYPPAGVHTFYVGISNHRCGIQETKSVVVMVLPRAKADFQTDKVVGCAPLSVNFSNTSSNANRFYWTYIENAAEFPLAPASQNFTENLNNNLLPYLPRHRIYKLIVSKDGACPDSTKKEIVVYPQINADFIPLDQVSCNPLSVQFQNLSSGNVTDSSYHWEFGDGSSSKLKDPLHVFTNEFRTTDTTYNVRLVTTSPYFCRDTANTTAKVRPFIKANYTVDTIKGCSPFTIQIKNKSLGGITRSEWVLNNVAKKGSVGKDTVITLPVNTSADTVGYNLVLRVWNAAGCKDSLIRHFTVFPEYSASFTANNTNICNATPVNFIATPSNPLAVTTYLWDFGDGSSAATQNTSHIFTNNTNADITNVVKLTVTSKFNNCPFVFTRNVTVHPYIEAQFATDVSSTCAPYNAIITNKSMGFTTKYTWNFGDNSPLRTGISMLNGDTLRHNYDNISDTAQSAIIKLILETAGGCKDSLTRMVTLYPKVTALFTMDQKLICNLGSVKFTPTPPIATNLVWQFGDGSSSALTSPTHLYSHLKTTDTKYPVKLTATSQYNCRNSYTDTVTVYAYIKSGFTISTINVCSGQPFTLTNNSTGGISLYNWDFGNGFNRQYPAGSQPSPWTPSIPPPNSIPYLNTTSLPVTYKILLTVSNTHPQCTDTISRKITVYPDTRITGMTTNPNKNEFCDSSAVTFAVTTSAPVTTYFWDFGDGNKTITTTSSASHLFRNNTIKDTSYTVRVSITSGFNCTGSFTKVIKIHPFLEPRYTIDDANFCAPNTSTFTNMSQGGITKYTWSFGDASQPRIFNGSTIPNDTLKHLYDNLNAASVFYKVKLQVEHTDDNINFCRAADSSIIEVFPKIHAGFNDVAPGCNPLPVNFVNTTNALPNRNFLWQFGDGSSSSLENPVHTFSHLSAADTIFKVKLLTISENNCKDSITKDVSVYSFIKAGFTTNTASGCSQPLLPISINNSSVGGIDSLIWNYGDGTPWDKYTKATQPVTTVHNYTNNNQTEEIRKIFLTVQNSHSCKDTLTRTIRVYPKVTADFSGIFAGCNPLTVNFTNNSNIPVANKFLWEFGDGSSSDLPGPDHIFTHLSLSDTIFPVKLLVQSQYNCKDSVTKDVTVFSYIDAKFTIDKLEGCSPLTVTIKNGYAGGTVLNSWDYGDNTDTNSSPLFTHTYTNQVDRLQEYKILLTVSNNHSCTDTVSRKVIVYPEVNAAIGTFGNITEGCNKLTINFIDQSGPMMVPVKYRWEFGDGGSSDVQYPSHTFENLSPDERIFKTKLFAYSKYNCFDSADIDIKVYPFIKADFSFAKPSGCSPVSIDITNSSSPGTNRFYWTYGNGLTGSEGLGTFTQEYRNLYPTSVIIKPKLVVAYFNGTRDMCFDSITRSLEVFPEVTASFNETLLSGCQPLSVTFENTSYLGVDGASRQAFPAELSYSWTFGDASSSNVQNPQHAFWNFDNVADSIYKVTLVATSTYKCTHSVTKDVTVFPSPKADFYLASSISCPPFPVDIINLSIGGSTYKWWWGDNPNSSFPLTPDFTNYSKEIVNHEYDNLSPATATYVLKLLVESQHNCTHSTQQTINVHPQAIVDFTSDKTAGCSPLQVQFTNNSLQTGSYEWDFGDLSTSLLTNPAHLFFNNSQIDSVFHIKLTAFTKYGCSKTVNHDLTIYPQPKPEFELSKTHLNFPISAVNITNFTNPGPWSYLWDFGDGNGSSVKDPLSHEYARWGDFDIKLKAWSNTCSDSITHHIKIIPPIPIANFVKSENGCVPLTVNFEDKSTWTTSRTWEFDDGEPSSDVNPVHVYQTPGKYQVKLTVRGDGGEIYTYQEVEVYPKPEVNFTYSPVLVMLPNANVKFYNTSKLATQFLWDFGDSEKSSEVEPLHKYEELGIYDLKLEAWTEYGCYDSKSALQAVEVTGTGTLRYPNAFRPSETGANDGTYTLPDIKNEVFHPYWAGVTEYHLEIYNRWGEKLFESDDINIGWNGYYKGKLCKGDVYIWKATGKYNNGKTFDYAGNITLLR